MRARHLNMTPKVGLYSEMKVAFTCAQCIYPSTPTFIHLEAFNGRAKNGVQFGMDLFGLAESKTPKVTIYVPNSTIDLNLIPIVYLSGM